MNFILIIQGVKRFFLGICQIFDHYLLIDKENSFKKYSTEEEKKTMYESIYLTIIGWGF